MDAIPVTFHLTADEQTYLEFCLVRRRELLALGDAAPHGQVLAHCESAAVEIARQQARQLLRDAIARRVTAAEKKGPRPGPAPVGGCDTTGGRMSARS